MQEIAESNCSREVKELMVGMTWREQKQHDDCVQERYTCCPSLWKMSMISPGRYREERWLSRAPPL